MPRRILEGKVVSDKSDKTITVLVERRVKDTLYKKVVRHSAKYAAHDESNNCKIGDMVTIEECRPVSKRKTWRVITDASESTKKEKPKAKKTTVKEPAAKKETAKKAVEKKTAVKKETAAKDTKKKG